MLFPWFRCLSSRCSSHYFGSFISVYREPFRMSSSLTSKFEEAQKRIGTLKEDPGNEVKLKLYALFKQATVGKCNVQKPSAFDFVGKAKWEAWNSLGNVKQEDAKNRYISLVDELVSDAGTTGSSSESNDIIVEVEKTFTKIIFNRPAKKNAITIQMYTDMVNALKTAAENDTAFAVITGRGDYYSSGNDLSNFGMAANKEISEMAKDAANLLKNFVAAFIDFPKPLIAAINGPAVGIPVTLLGLFDSCYASDKATFYTPFSLLGQSPEACASYTFPKIMGYGKASELLMFNKKLSAAEAKEFGLINEVFPHDKFEQEMRKITNSISATSKQSLLFTKKLLRDVEKDTLHQVNAAECDRLAERWQSPDCMEAIMNFFQKKGKL